MMKVSNLNEIGNIVSPVLRSHIAKKAKELMEEYNVDNLDNIGCFVVLEKDGITEFAVNEMEFTEVLEISGETYLHGVRILSDSFGEDIFLPIEVIKCH